MFFLLFCSAALAGSHDVTILVERASGKTLASFPCHVTSDHPCHFAFPWKKRAIDVDIVETGGEVEAGATLWSGLPWTRESTITMKSSDTLRRDNPLIEEDGLRVIVVPNAVKAE